MKIKDLRESDRPREKAIIYGVSNLSDNELMAIILGSGTKNHNILDISNNILKLVDGKKDITLSMLKNIEGVGNARGLTILAFLELSRRLNTKKVNKIKFRDTDSVFHYLKKKYKTDAENLFVLYFDKKGYFTKEAILGDHNPIRVKVDADSIVRTAMKNDAYFVILAHNHPSGNPNPSSEDKTTTNSIKESLSLLNIKLIDHIIFTDTEYFSFLNHQLL